MNRCYARPHRLATASRCSVAGRAGPAAQLAAMVASRPMIVITPAPGKPTDPAADNRDLRSHAGTSLTVLAGGQTAPGPLPEVTGTVQPAGMPEPKISMH